MDFWHRITTYTDHNRYLVLGLGLFAVSSGWLAGCRSTTGSLVDPGRSVTRAQLSLEVIELSRDLAVEKARLDASLAEFNTRVSAHNDRITSANADLDAKDAMRAQVIDVVGGALTSVATGGAINLPGLISTGATLLLGFGGGGAILDNRRKDKIISKNGT